MVNEDRGRSLAMAAIVISIISTLLMAVGEAWGFSSYQQNISALLANYGARITNLEQERNDDRRDLQQAQSQITTRLDTIMSQIAQLQVSIANKADRRQ